MPSPEGAWVMGSVAGRGWAGSCLHSCAWTLQEWELWGGMRQSGGRGCFPLTYLSKHSFTYQLSL